MLVRSGRLVLVGFGGLLAALLAAAWLAPRMLDWNRYRDEIAQLASLQLGRGVHVGGGVTLQLLPQPILTASDVVVEGAVPGTLETGASQTGGSAPPAGDGIALRARALRLRVALVPLLRGQVDARELTLQGAELHLPWPPPAGAMVQRPPAWLSGLQARVEGGRLEVGGLVLSGVEATVSTDADTGTLSIAGRGESGPADAGRDGPGRDGPGRDGPGRDGPGRDGPGRDAGLRQSWQFTARLGRPGRDGSAALDLSLDGHGRLRDTGGTFSGVLGADGALQGRVAGRGPDLSLLLAAPALPWRGDGRLSASGGLAVADELALEIGGAPARGAVALRLLPEVRLDIAIAAGRLDLDAWLPALVAWGPGPGLGQGQGQGQGLGQGRVAGAAGLSTVPTGIDLSAEAATLAGGTLRRLRGAFDLLPDGVMLRDVTAVLPGEAELSLSGRIRRAGEAHEDFWWPETPSIGVPVFEGPVRIVAPDVRATLRWAQRGLPGWVLGLPPGVLRAGVLQGRVAAALSGPAQGRVELSGTLDGGAATVAGSLRQAAQAGAPGRPALTLAATLERMALEAWLPGLQPGAVSLEDGVGAAATALAALRTIDGDLRLRVAQTEWGGVAPTTLQLGALTLELQSEAARVALRRLEVQPLGGRLAVSAQVLGVGAEARLADGRLDFALADAAALRPVLGADLGRALQGRLTLAAQAAGPLEAVTGRMVAELGDARLEAQPTVTSGGRRWAGSLTVHHPGAARLLSGLGWAGTGAWLGDGSFSLVGQAAVQRGEAGVGQGGGREARVELEGATLAAGSLRVTGRLAAEGRRVTGALVAETLPLPALDLRSAEPLPFAALRPWQGAVRLEAGQVLLGQEPVAQAAAGELSLQNGVLRVANGVARLGSGTLAGGFSLNAGAEPPAADLQARVAGVALEGVWEVPGLSGVADAAVELSSGGYSPAALLATVQGRGMVRVRDGVAQGFDLGALRGALARVSDGAGGASLADGVRRAATGGTTAFAAVEGPVSIERGVATVDVRLVAQPGGAAVRGTLDLVGGTAGLVVRLQPGPGLPDVPVRLSGPWDRVVRVPELSAVLAWQASRDEGRAPSP